MESVPSKLAPIYKKWEEMNTSRVISEAYLEILGERLAIAFTAPERQQRRSSRGQKQNYKSVHQRKKARKIYLEVFETDVHIFIPFILAVSPRACETFNISIFHQYHEKKPKISLRDNALSLLWKAATEYGCDKTSQFKKLVLSPMHMPSPVTGAEGKECEHWSLRLSGFAEIQSVFGDVIFDAVRLSPTELEMGSRFSETTTNVWTRVPRQQHQDAVITLHVGRANELANMLFPNESQKIASALSTYSPILPLTSPSLAPLGSENSNSELVEIDSAYFTLRGASVAAFPTMFSTEICRGIDDSQLRTWEREQLLIDTTDCVTMQVWRARPYLGIIRLRIGNNAGSHLANVLYKETC